ncbi:hypothetical protein [Clostridium paraputrificum]|uniref:HipA-like C-terminal domain-containing protein n=1 Tax=Clostridium paraputrificum TaxID=29363 RepID=A0A6N3F8B9_9CLOT
MIKKSSSFTKSNLMTMSLSSTARGVLLKWTCLRDGVIHYFKSGSLTSLGSFSPLQPQAEIMAYRIGSQLGFPNLVETKGSTILLPETERYSEQYALLSYTKSFLRENDVQYQGISKCIPRKDFNNVDLYQLIVGRFPSIKQDLDLMILFDFIILNIDRHLNNFGLIIDVNNDYRLSPLFDNGLSLLAQFNSEELSVVNETFIRRRVKVKPFRSDSYKQLKLIDVKNIPKELVNSINSVNLDWDSVFYNLDISKKRKNMIIRLVEDRLSYVKDLLS